jgi:hypothetical protein
MNRLEWHVTAFAAPAVLVTLFVVPAGGAPAANAKANIEQRKLELEQRTLDLQQQALQLERDKFAMERDLRTRELTIEDERRKIEEGKAKQDAENAVASRTQTGVAAGSVVATLIGLLIAALSQGSSVRQQGRDGFRLKCIELIISSRSKYVAEQRSKVLAAFGERWLGNQLFADKTWANDMPGHGHEQRVELFRALSQNLGKEQSILDEFRQIFPDDYKAIYEPKKETVLSGAVGDAADDQK